MALIQQAQLSARAILNIEMLDANQFSFTQIQIPIGQMVVDAQNSAIAADQQLKNDVNALDTYNEEASELNARVIPVLSGIAGKNFGQDCKVWTDWYVNQLGYAASTPDPSSKPTIVENVPADYINPGGANVGYLQARTPL